MMFSFPAMPVADFDASTNGRGLPGIKKAGGHESAGKAGLPETDADADAAFARLLEGAFACEDNDPAAFHRIVSAGREAGVDPGDIDELFRVLKSFGPMHADGVFAGGGDAPGIDVPADLSGVPERLGRMLSGWAAGRTGMQSPPGGPVADHLRGMPSAHPVPPGAATGGVDAALARIVSAFSRNAGEGGAPEHHAARTPEPGNPMAGGRSGDESAVKMSAFNGASGGVEDARGRLPDISGGASGKRFGEGVGEGVGERIGKHIGDGNDKAAAGSAKESQKMRTYLDALAEQITTGGKKGPDGRTGLKMTGFREGVADALQQAAESSRSQDASGFRASMTAAPATGSMSGPLPPVGGEAPVFGGDGGFQGAMAESAGGKGHPAAQDAGNPGSPSAAAFDKHLQSPAQSLENRVVGQVFMRLFTGAGRGSSSMTVNIHPPELGSVRVRIVSGNGRMSVHLNAQNQQVAGILERNLPALHQSLADQGIDIDDLHVSVDSEERESADFEERTFTGRPAGNPSSGPDTETDAPSTEPLAEYGYKEGRGLSLRV